jgi:hypothetical protein
MGLKDFTHAKLKIIFGIHPKIARKGHDCRTTSLIRPIFFRIFDIKPCTHAKYENIDTYHDKNKKKYGILE